MAPKIFKLGFIFILCSVQVRARPLMELTLAGSVVSAESTSEILFFGKAGFQTQWTEKPWFLVVNYFRNLSLLASVGSFNGTTVTAGYNLISASWRKDLQVGMGLDYQIVGFSFGQVPMLGVFLSANGSWDHAPFFWEILTAGFYKEQNSVYDVRPTWRVHTLWGWLWDSNLSWRIEYSYHLLNYKNILSAAPSTELVLTALSFGFGYSY